MRRLEATPYTFLIEQGEQSRQVTGRDNAVQRARSLSQRSHLPVEVKREDRKMTMLFRNGSLQTYQLEIR